MRRIYLFSNAGKVTTRVVPLRFKRARPAGDAITATGLGTPACRGIRRSTIG